MRSRAPHQGGLGLIPGFKNVCGMSLLLVLVLALRGFSSGSLVFPSPQKPTFSNSNFVWRVSDTITQHELSKKHFIYFSPLLL